MGMGKKPGWYGAKLHEYGVALKAGDFSVIPRIFCVLAENHPDGKPVAAGMLRDVLKTMTFDDLVRTDRRMRQTSSMEWDIDWSRLPMESFFTLDMGKDSRFAVTVFASFNPNGFIRERAVRKMKGYAGALPFAILRQNDWVSRVRVAAVDTVDYRLAHLAAGELIAALPFVDQLSRGGRTQNANATVSRIHSSLGAEENEKDLARGLGDASVRIRRICITALFRSEHPRYGLAIAQLKRETDPFLRASIFRKLLSAGQDFSSIAGSFLTDRYPPNRVLAFRSICAADPANALGLAGELLLDKNAAVRACARAVLDGTVPGFDYRAHYKAHMDNCAAPAILGLGETGIAEDSAKIEEYLESAQIAVVRAAMNALMRLDGERFVPAITRFLSDHRAGVVKTARNLIIKTGSPDYAKVMEIFHATPYVNTKQKCFSVLLTASKWQRLVFILDALETGGTEMTEPAKAALERWMGRVNRAFSVATPDQVKEISDRIQRVKGELSARTLRELLFLVGGS